MSGFISMLDASNFSPLTYRSLVSVLLSCPRSMDGVGSVLFVCPGVEGVLLLLRSFMDDGEYTTSLL